MPLYVGAPCYGLTLPPAGWELHDGACRRQL